MKRQLSNTIYGLKFAMEKNVFERLQSSSGTKRNDFVANPIFPKVSAKKMYYCRTILEVIVNIISLMTWIYNIITHEETYLSVREFDFLFSIYSYRFWVDVQRGLTRITLSFFITNLLNFKVGRFLLLLGAFEPMVFFPLHSHTCLRLIYVWTPEVLMIHAHSTRSDASNSGKWRGKNTTLD